MTTATPTKLRTGAWGARVPTADVSVGDEITITSRAGKSWQARVSKVVWTGEGQAIVATESLDQPARSSHSHRPTRGSHIERCYHGHTSPVAGCRDCFDTFDY